MKKPRENLGFSMRYLFWPHKLVAEEGLMNLGFAHRFGRLLRSLAQNLIKASLCVLLRHFISTKKQQTPNGVCCFLASQTKKDIG